LIDVLDGGQLRSSPPNEFIFKLSLPSLLLYEFIQLMVVLLLEVVRKLWLV
jgi:hypothetical protein